MHDVLSQLFGYIWGIWRYRWQGLILACVIAAVGWGFVFKVPEQYEATARVHVDTNSILRPLLRGLAIRPDIDQRIELMSRTLLSRPNLEKLMRMTDLDLKAKNDKEKDIILKQLLENIKLSGSSRNSSLYTVSFQHPDRDLAKRVVQSLLTVFIESTLGEERQDNTGAQNFLDQQIAEYETRLVEAETRLANFKQKYVGVLPGQAGGYYSRLEAARTQFSEARLQLSEMENRRDELKRQLAGEEPGFFSGGSGTPTSTLDGRIEALEARLDDLMSRYTERYPEVVQIRKLLEELEAEREAEIARAFAEASVDYSGLQSSPVYQQMRAMLAESDARIAELSVRVKEYKGRVKELEDMVDNIPIIEAEQKQLNRDYEVISAQHAELLQRREAAKISEDVEQKANDLVIRVIDPPFVPQKPNKPDKLILNSAVFVASIGAGGALAFLLSLLHPVVIDRRGLGVITGLPVLGSVTYIPSPVEKRQTYIKSLQYILALFLLLVVFLVINIVQQWLI